MFGLFKKFKEGLAKTVSAIASKTHGLFGGRKIDVASLDELEEALYTADFGVETTNEILAEIKRAYGQDKELRGKQAAEIGAAVLQRVLAGSEGVLEVGGAGLSRNGSGHEAISAAPKPIVIAMIGVNGSGKTTTAAKLAWRLKEDGRSVMLAACDTFRAAAIEQLKSWATRFDLEIIASHTGADSAAVAFDAWQAANSRGRDYLIVDTAGRLHTKSNLMDELAKIRRVLQKNDPTAPQHRWLVVDGSLGSNSIEQARVFSPELRSDGSRRDQARWHEPGWCAGRHLPPAQDSDLFSRTGGAGGGFAAVQRGELRQGGVRDRRVVRMPKVPATAGPNFRRPMATPGCRAGAVSGKTRRPWPGGAPRPGCRRWPRRSADRARRSRTNPPRSRRVAAIQPISSLAPRDSARKLAQTGRYDEVGKHQQHPADLNEARHHPAEQGVEDKIPPPDRNPGGGLLRGE